MNREAINTAIVTAIEARKASWAVYPLVVEYNNRLLVNLQTQANPFLQARVIFMGGEQVDLGANPNHRTYGQLHLAAAVREGEGWLLADRLLDFFTPVLHMRSLSGVRMLGSMPAKDIHHLGWVYYPVLIPFEADTLS